MQETGQLSINAENILPIIKKWLYSEKEIFLRELVSNAMDAMHKLAKVALVEQVRDTTGDSKVSISIDKQKKTLTITDSGIGMTADEVRKYIAQVAFSGAQDFVTRYQGKDEESQIIGHFGLGFYSSFMVADRVEIESLSCRPDTEAVYWSSEGKIDYIIRPATRTEVGTSITLHISEDSQEMLEASKITEILNKYCQFMSYPIELEGKQVNDTRPIWTRSATELNDKDYLDFFHKMFPFSPDPLFWIHLNVDFPFKLKGVLYFPKLKHELDASQGEVKLFCNQVFVADNCKELVPEFLTLLKGAIDCPDLPLNVSRSNLQNEPQVRKISQHILKKVGDRLLGLAKNERQEYEKFWSDIAPFIKFGMLKESAFYERMIEHTIFATGSGSFVTLDEYLERNKEKTEGKIIYATDSTAQSSYISMHGDHGVDVIIADTMIDGHFLPFVEMQSSRKYKFERVDATMSKHLMDSAPAAEIVDPTDQRSGEEKAESLFRKYLEKQKVKVQAKTLKSEDVPAILIFDENLRRMKEMGRQFAGGAAMGHLTDDDHTLVVNLKSPVIKNLLTLGKSFNKEKEIATIVNHVYDLAYLQQGRFDEGGLKSFLKRTSTLLERFGSDSNH